MWWWKVPVVLFVASAARADNIFERDVLETVNKALDSIGDFSSLNDNYLQNQALLDEMNQYFGAKEVPGLAFDLQSGVNVETDYSNESLVFIATQVTYGVYDVPEEMEVSIGVLKMKRTSSVYGESIQVRLFEEEFTCTAFVLDFVDDELQKSEVVVEVLFAQPFGAGGATNVLQSKQLVLDEAKLAELYNTLQGIPRSQIRIKVDTRADDEEALSEAQINALSEQASRWLEYVGSSFLFRYVYALLSMNREQVLAEEFVDLTTTATIVPNVFFLNQQLFSVQQELQKLPYIFDFGSRHFLEQTTQLFITNRECDRVVPEMPVTYYKGDLVDSSLATKKTGSLALFGGNELEEVYSSSIALNIASGVVARTSLETRCRWLDSEAKYEFKDKNKSLFQAQGLYTCNHTLAATMDVIFSSAYSTPYDIEAQSYLGFNLTHAGEAVEFQYRSPTAITIEQAGYMAYGLRFQQSSGGYLNTLGSVSWVQNDLPMDGSVYKYCNGDCYIILNNDLHMVDFAFLLPLLNKMPRPFHAFRFASGYSGYEWNKDLQIRAHPGALSSEHSFEFRMQFSAKLSTSLQTLCKVQIDRFGDAMPFSQQNSLNILAFQLNDLSNQVSELEDRVDSLEAAVYQNEKSVLWFIGNGLSMIDIAFNVYELGKFSGKLFKPSHSTMKRQSPKQPNPLGHQFAEKTHSSKMATTYSVMDGINSATQVSHLQGHNKRYFYNPTAAKKEPADIDFRFIKSNKQDVRELMEINPTVYSKVQMQVYEKLQTSKLVDRDFTKQPFGIVSVHKSPIDAPPGTSGASKFIADRFQGTQSGRAFIANDQQRFPFHTSVSSNSIEIRADDKIVLNTRFTGVAEPSIIGPTNAKNPRVKVGYVKIQHEVIELPDGSAKLKLLSWKETEITPGKFYSESDVDNLFSSFFPKNKQQAQLTSDEKWQLVAHQTARRVNTRDTIDYVPLQSNIFLGSLDEMMFFSKEGGNFKYNLLNNNCQTYAKAFAQMAAYGSTQLDLVASDFRAFSLRLASFAEKYFSNSPAMTNIVHFVAKNIQHVATSLNFLSRQLFA